MATYTRDQLRDDVLRELGVIDIHGIPSAADAKLASERCQQVLELLYDQGYIPFDLDSDTIPARYFLPVKAVVSYHLMLPYGVTSRAQVLQANMQGGMDSLVLLKNHRDMGETLRVDYF